MAKGTPVGDMLLNVDEQKLEKAFDEIDASLAGALKVFDEPD